MTDRISISQVNNSARQHGFTLVELLVATALAAMLIAGLGGVAGLVAETQDTVQDKNELTRQARFAMDQMVRSVSYSRRLLLPMNDNPNTSWPEHIREQTIPLSPPIGSSTLATAVLAVTLPVYFDLDGNGSPDADNDGDSRIDEDLGGDASNDGQPGIIGIDDNGDGTADISSAAEPNKDDDEDNDRGEDSRDGIDNDGDGSVDEDMNDDANNDGQAGVTGVDDDFDFSVDEGDKKDDDEDGQVDEDGYDPVVFYLNSGNLIERTPVPWDTNADALVTGADFIESEIAENVTRFRVERVAGSGNFAQLVDITLELTSAETGEMVRLQTQVRLGGAL